MNKNMSQIIRISHYSVLVVLGFLLGLFFMKKPLDLFYNKQIAANPNYIELACKYESCSIDQSDCKNLETLFSIDLLKKQVTGGGSNSYGVFSPENTIADVTPDHISIKQYYLAAVVSKPQFLINQFFIDRFTGIVYADHYNADEKPFDEGDKKIIIKNSKGTCRRIENRLF